MLLVFNSICSDNLFLVGDGCKESGFIMAEGVATSVNKVVAKILHK